MAWHAIAGWRLVVRPERRSSGWRRRPPRTEGSTDDRKLTGQDEVAREQHVVVNQHDLVVRGVRRSVVTQHRAVTARSNSSWPSRTPMSGSTNSTLRSRGVSSGRRRENVSMYHDSGGASLHLSSGASRCLVSAVCTCSRQHVPHSSHVGIVGWHVALGARDRTALGQDNGAMCSTHAKPTRHVANRVRGDHTRRSGMAGCFEEEAPHCFTEPGGGDARLSQVHRYILASATGADASAAHVESSNRTLCSVTASWSWTSAVTARCCVTTDRRTPRTTRSCWLTTTCCSRATCLTGQFRSCRTSSVRGGRRRQPLDRRSDELTSLQPASSVPAMGISRYGAIAEVRDFLTMLTWRASFGRMALGDDAGASSRRLCRCRVGRFLARVERLRGRPFTPLRRQVVTEDRNMKGRNSLVGVLTIATCRWMYHHFGELPPPRHRQLPEVLCARLDDCLGCTISVLYSKMTSSRRAP